MKFVDAKCPNCGGTVKILPDGKTGKCENCAAELQIETEISDRLTRAFDLIFQQRFLGAEKTLNEVLNLDSKNGQAYLGLLLCDLSLRSPELLTQAKLDYSNYANYIRACQFLDEEQKNDLIQCCIINKERLINIQNIQAQISYPTPLMEEFTKNDSLESNGRTFSIIGTIANMDFDNMSDEQIVRLYINIKHKMKNIIDINARLSDEEKNHLNYYSSKQTTQAINIFLGIEATLKETGLL